MSENLKSDPLPKSVTKINKPNIKALNEASTFWTCAYLSKEDGQIIVHKTNERPVQ